MKSMRRKDPELMQRISDYIGDYYRQNHSTPTTREISSAMGLAPATGYKYLVEMNKQGLLSYENGEITDLPKIKKTETGYFSAPLVGSIRCGDCFLQALFTKSCRAFLQNVAIAFYRDLQASIANR